MDMGDVCWSLGMMAASGVIEAGESLARNTWTSGCASRLLSAANASLNNTLVGTAVKFGSAT